MSEAKVPETPVLKGVITEVTDDGNMGTINCGGGNVFTFAADQLDTGYEPVLKDIVEFNLIEDQPFAIRLYHREKAMEGSSGASVDLRVKCPSCGKPIIPKAVVENGRVTSVRCPECLKEIEKVEKPPKTNFFIWLLAILLGIVVGVAVYTVFTP